MHRNRTSQLVVSLKLDPTSLAIGVGIGVVTLAAVVILYLLPFGGTDSLDSLESDILSSSDNASFFMFGLLREINPEVMVIDQTFGRYSPEQPGGANPGVQVRLDKGAVFMNCHENGEGRQQPEASAKTIAEQQLARGVHVCALVSNFGDGLYYAGKIWLNTECSLAAPVPSSLSAEGITLGTPYLVKISWDVREMIYGNSTDLSVSIKDRDTMEPLNEVTYEFGYKGLSELGRFQDRFVEDFSNPDKFRTGIKNPCEMHLMISVDKVGDQSFKKTDPNDNAKYGNTSSVFIQFRTSPMDESQACDYNNLRLSLHNGYDLQGNRV